MEMVSAARARGYPISGPILQEKAKQIADCLGVANQFSASEGWLQKWKQRNNVRSYKVCGESGNVDLEAAAQWKTSLTSLISGYDLKNVFNMDETGFFFRALPDSTLNHVAESCKGGKQGKDRVTVALTCSAMGEKLPPLIIGKSKNPRAFRGIDTSKFKAKYLNSAKAWMTNPLFNIYLKGMDDFFKHEGRKILLFLDNAPVHIVDEATKLINVELRYFPPNLTSVLQPLDAGIIRSLKALSRKFEVLTLLDLMEDSSVHASELAKKLTVLDAIKFIEKSWDLVKPETIQKYFVKCGFTATEVVQQQDMTEILQQEQELASLAQRIGVDSSRIVVEENLPECEIQEEESLIEQLVEEFIDVASDDEVRNSPLRLKTASRNSGK